MILAHLGLWRTGAVRGGAGGWSWESPSGGTATKPAERERQAKPDPFHKKPRHPVVGPKVASVADPKIIAFARSLPASEFPTDAFQVAVRSVIWTLRTGTRYWLAPADDTAAVKDPRLDLLPVLPDDRGWESQGVVCAPHQEHHRDLKAAAQCQLISFNLNKLRRSCKEAIRLGRPSLRVVFR